MPEPATPEQTERTATAHAPRMRPRPSARAAGSDASKQTGRRPQRTLLARATPGRAPGPNGFHPLTDHDGNARLQRYEERVKTAFDRIVPVLKRLSALQHEADFEQQAQSIARAELGFDLPEHMLADAWVDSARPAPSVRLVRVRDLPSDGG